MKKISLPKIILLLIVCLISAITYGQSTNPSRLGYESKDVENGKGYIYPDNGLVPNDTVAIKIAEAVWLPLYGDEIYSERPFWAHLDSVTNIWTVGGTIDGRGGTATAKIQKKDGRILLVLHYK